MVEPFCNLGEGGTNCTPAMLNAIIAAHAWHGDVPRCMELLEVYRDNGWSPDDEAFSFVLESVGKATQRLNRAGHRAKNQLTASYFEAAESILGGMEQTIDQDGNPVTPSHHFVRNYVEMLCSLGEVETGGLVATDLLKDKGSPEQRVDNKTLWRLAWAHADLGHYDKAREFAASTSEVLPFMEEKMNHLELKDRNESQTSQHDADNVQTEYDLRANAESSGAYRP